MATPLLTDLTILRDRWSRSGLGTSEMDAVLTAVIADVSAVVRSYTGQEFTEATTTERLRVQRGVVRLPQRPVAAVSAVEDINGNAVAYQWDGLDKLRFVGTGLENRWDLEGYSVPLEVVDVTYTHGYATIPDDIEAVVTNMTLRAVSIDQSNAAIQQESIGGYSYTMGGAAAAGPLGLLLGERQVLDKYRRTAGVVWQR